MTSDGSATTERWWDSYEECDLYELEGEFDLAFTVVGLRGRACAILAGQ